MNCLARRCTLAAMLAGAGSTGLASAATPTEGNGPFPYPGEFHANMCSLGIDSDGAFVMNGFHCDFPEIIEGPDVFMLSNSGRARVQGDHLQLYYADQWPAGAAPHQELMVLQCDGGVRFVDDEAQRTVAMATHSGDPSELWFGAGFTKRQSRTRGNCDPAPLPPELARIARSPPVSGLIRSVQPSDCKNDGDWIDCETSGVLDRGAGEGLVDGMSLYFATCSGNEAGVNMSIRGVAVESAHIRINWTRREADRDPRLVGAGVVTRMPACQVAEYERIERKAEEDSQ